MPDHAVEPLDLSDRATAEDVLRVQRSAYRAEADLIGFDGIPQLRETLAALLEAGLTWLGIRDRSGRVIAAVAYEKADGVIDIHRLVVDPSRFREGLGSALVAALDESLPATVATGKDNRPAHRLYEGLGFKRSHEERIAPELSITHFVRRGKL